MQVWQKVNDYECELADQLDKKKQIDKQLETMKASYEKLQKTNFINEVFHISTLNEFGTISGFRLGTIVGMQNVPWEEINAALGQTAYLMAVIAHRFGFKFPEHKISLCGALSKIMLKYEDKPTKYPLYYKVFGSEKPDMFNRAVGYLLLALKSLQDKAVEVVKLNYPTQKFPLQEIVKDASGKVCIGK